MLTLVLPCAGSGSRLGAQGAKTLVEVAGKTILERILDEVIACFDEIIIVTRLEDKEEIENCVQKRFKIESLFKFVVQTSPTGSLDAILVGLEGATAGNDLVIIWGDQVGVSRSTVSEVCSYIGDSFSNFCMPVISTKSPYVWINLSEEGKIESVGRKRDGDQSPSEGLADLGVFGFSSSLREVFLRIRSSIPIQNTRERDFIYILPAMSQNAKQCHIIEVHDQKQIISVNTPEELELACEFFG